MDGKAVVPLAVHALVALGIVYCFGLGWLAMASAGLRCWRRCWGDHEGILKGKIHSRVDAKFAS